MVGRARGRDVSVTMVTALGTLLAFKAIQGLAGVDPTLLEPDPEVTIEESDVQYVEASWAEVVIRGRPWVPHKRMATIARGTRLVVRGEVKSRDKEGCGGKNWYAVWPFGYVCSKHVLKSKKAPEAGAAMPLPPGRRVPHAYAIVRGQDVPQYKTVADAEAGIPDRNLKKGMILVVRRSLEIDGLSYIETKGGKYVPKANIGWMGQGSEWQGVRIEDAKPGPLFAWVRKDKVPVHREAVSDSEKVRTLKKRERIRIYEDNGDWRRVGDNEWVRRADLNEVIIMDPPEGVLTEFRVANTGNRQWVDVDVGEQVLIAYRGTDPIYATLVSSGRGHPTPLGNYPVWAKVASMDMSNQGYEDNAYMVQGVPWVLLFQGHNALHGAYWHNRFGNRKSHGCVNLAPLDARWVFDWVGPTLPYGWTGYLPVDLNKSPVVHVRDTSRAPGNQFTQKRPWGPPDFVEERRRTEAAEARRLAAAEREEPKEPAPIAPAPPPVRRIVPPRTPGAVQN